MPTPVNTRISGPYTATGGETVLGYTFELLSAGDLAVYRKRAGTVTLLVLSTDYAVAGIGIEAGGLITLTAPAAAGDQYLLKGARPPQRLTSLVNQNALSAPLINGELDALQIQIAEVREAVGSALASVDPFAPSLGYNVEQAQEAAAAATAAAAAAAVSLAAVETDAAVIAGMAASAVSASAAATATAADLATRGVIAATTDAGAGILKVGMSVDWHTETPPPGWLHENGQAVSRAAYPELWALYSANGTVPGIYGNGNGTTTFNLRNTTGLFKRGWNNGGSNDPDAASRTNRGDGTAGDRIGTKQASRNAPHVHSGTGLSIDNHSFTPTTVLNTGTFPSGAGPIALTNVIMQPLTLAHVISGNTATEAPTGGEARPSNIAVMSIVLASRAAAAAGTLGVNGLLYQFNAFGAAAANPGYGLVSASAANFNAGSSGTLYISKREATSADLSLFLATLAINQQLKLTVVGGLSTFAILKLTANATSAGAGEYYVLSYVVIASGGTIETASQLSVDVLVSPGPQGPSGGVDGKTILPTVGAPSNATGANGDLAYDAAAKVIYGPKAAGAWPAGVSLSGTNGTNGNTVLTTSGAPSNAAGVNGDFAYDPAAKIMYGPKAGGAWPGGVSLAGGVGGGGTPSEAQGRLTLATLTPVMLTDVLAAATIFYTPHLGRHVPLWNGTDFVMADFGGELSQALTDATKSPAAAAASKNYDMFVWLDGSTPRCTRGPAWSMDTTRGTGAATSELDFVKGFCVNKVAITNGPPAGYGLYVGTIRTNASALVDFNLGSLAAGGGAASIGVWNAFSRVRWISFTGETADGWSYASSTIRAANNSAGMRATYVSGLDREFVVGQYNCQVSGGSGIAALVGVQKDATTSYGGSSALVALATTGSNTVSGMGRFTAGLGLHFISANESTNGSTANFFGDDGSPAARQSGLFVEGMY